MGDHNHHKVIKFPDVAEFRQSPRDHRLKTKVHEQREMTHSRLLIHSSIVNLQPAVKQDKILQ